MWSLLAVSTALAADFEHAATPDVHFTVSLPCGSLTFHSGQSDQVLVRGEFPPTVTPRFEGTNGDLTFVVPLEETLRRGNTDCTNVDIALPEKASVDASSTNGAVTIHGVRGTIRIEAINGAVTVGDLGAKLSVSAVNGPIDITDLHGTADIETVNGSITIAAKDTAELHTQTVNGNTTVRGGPVHTLDAQTVQGDIVIEGSLATDARFSLDSHAGNIVVRVPKGAGYIASLESFSGDIVNHASDGKPSRAELGPGTHLDATIGNGSARIDAQTFSGNIEIAASP